MQITSIVVSTLALGALVVSPKTSVGQSDSSSPTPRVSIDTRGTYEDMVKRNPVIVRVDTTYVTGGAPGKGCFYSSAPWRAERGTVVSEEGKMVDRTNCKFRIIRTIRRRASDSLTSYRHFFQLPIWVGSRRV